MIRKTLLAAVLALGACRGQPSDKQPLHLVPDMDWQPKFKAEMESTIKVEVGQEERPLFDYRRAMRPPVEGTVALVSAQTPMMD